MSLATLHKNFEKMGARVKVGASPSRWDNSWHRFEDSQPHVILNVLKDKDGEFFDVRVDNPHTQLTVLESNPKDRHLLLMAATADPRNQRRKINSKFLCGHDERHWFIAAVPDGGITSVKQAKNALKPTEAVESERKKSLAPKFEAKRHNVAWKRQGEWFFVPDSIRPSQWLVLQNEPFFRNDRRGGKPHHAEFSYRTGGRTVWVSGTTVLEDAQYLALPKDERKTYHATKADPAMYVKGRISHPDHATLVLDTWHRVHMNRENLAALGMKHVAFID